MPEIQFSPLPQRSVLRTALESQARSFQPSLRIVATDVLADDGEIDLVAIAPDGDVVLLLIGTEADERALLIEALAQRIWVRARLENWRQLAPELGLHSDSKVRVALFSAAYSSQTRSACSEPSIRGVELFIIRAVEREQGLEIFIEPVPIESDIPTNLRSHVEVDVRNDVEDNVEINVESNVETNSRYDFGALPLPPFRSGLTQAELDLSPAELREFDRA